MQSNSQESLCDVVKLSSSENDGQDFLTPVAAVTTVSMGVSPPCAVEQEIIPLPTQLGGVAIAMHPLQLTLAIMKPDLLMRPHAVKVHVCGAVCESMQLNNNLPGR